MAWKMLLIWSVASVAITPMFAFLLQRSSAVPVPVPVPMGPGTSLPPAPESSARPAVCAAIRARHPSAVGRRHGRRCDSR